MKSGSRPLNDKMAQNIDEDIVKIAPSWSVEYRANMVGAYSIARQ